MGPPLCLGNKDKKSTELLSFQTGESLNVFLSLIFAVSILNALNSQFSSQSQFLEEYGLGSISRKVFLILKSVTFELYAEL